MPHSDLGRIKLPLVECVRDVESLAPASMLTSNRRNNDSQQGCADHVLEVIYVCQEAFSTLVESLSPPVRRIVCDILFPSTMATTGLPAMTPEYMNANKGPLFVAIFAAGIAVAIVLVGLRLWVRFKVVRKVGLDDYVMLASTVSHAFSIFWLLAVHRRRSRPEAVDWNIKDS